MIVEDNRDVRNYIRGHFQQSYRILEAKDGGEGLDKAIEKISDLIISDVMMPKMDGFEFCKRIKTDERTSHIPIILLTARAAENSKVKGLETGADDYLTNQTPRQFIRTLRLRRAAQLLQKGTGTVTEVAYMVGFNDISHFAKRFRELHGQLPSEYARRK